MSDTRRITYSAEHELLDLIERLEARERRHVRKRRAKKAALLVGGLVLGPLAGDMWAEQEAKGWR